ncbi:hypothetical protein F4820DRAFT_446922 [Hypoxylon rubiginosum]|uniref:Uncharacterized protein n=1 Tax=Hypoxylon rubiginosum TaxID=110542 RepID=A0ACB9Z653_9PEZI|nr:hypothetical protein F4820DRAFT_446922 [Hypoxylon rubiginosum]
MRRFVQRSRQPVFHLLELMIERNAPRPLVIHRRQYEDRRGDIGGNTTATTLRGTRYCCNKQIRSAFQSGAEISGTKLAACSYLACLACIDETPRMPPPLPGCCGASWPAKSTARLRGITSWVPAAIGYHILAFINCK